ncbi:MAG: GAF domain-containing protein [Erythrobacter sp.]|uniref:HWE histidine kinase domain-containing protein n=1 Tax=Erythrobacter sp. TaxID=1042 RepID=UPI0026342BAB|nr:HWE histidine kinase domain-containing protein [Erythrobacter sp.]MDJ0979050.1 GAF domain-containing protein [Erythrobacter sp.]
MNFHSTPRELTECDREPIHHIAAVQPFGALIALRRDWRVGQRSINCAELLNLGALPKIGAALDEVLLPKAVEALKSAARRLTEEDAVERLFGVALAQPETLFDCAVHKVGERVIVEFERHDPDEFVNHVSLIAPLVSKLETINDLPRLCSQTAKLVREMLGYDRVMVYKFHADESGEVIAEDAREDLEPYLGLRYPRADIPQQARDLFRRNRVRVIADVSAEPSPVDPAVTFGGQPLDLSMSVLRAHSNMHLKYLTNMGVGATLAMAIVRRGKLWGMISCHHGEPKLPSFSLRTVAETFSQMFSLILDRMLIDRSERLRSRGRDLHNTLMVNLADGESLGANVARVAEMLEGLIPHDGLSLKVSNEFTSYGAAPSEAEFAAIAGDLSDADVQVAYGTTNLAQHIPSASAFAERATGALIIPISRDSNEHLILWRQPLTQTVSWAGDPSKAKVATPGERLQPRESFAAWEKTVDGHSEEWSEDDLQIAEGLRVALLEVILRMSDEVARQRHRAQEQQDLLIAELNHRVRNILNLIRSLVSQSQHDAVNVESFASIVSGRIAALASAHDNITRENWTPAPLAKLFESEIEAYLTGKWDRFTLIGESVLIAPEAYTVLALVVHELMTNSAKYGSLCDRSGSVTVEVSRTALDDLAIAWRERGGPPVQPPTRRGFGSTIIERSIPFELKGEARLRFQLAGLEADFVVPRRYVSHRSAEVEADHPAASNDDNRIVAAQSPHTANGLPRRVLVVEDSIIIALDTEENLKRLGVGLVDVASSVAAGLAALRDQEPELAIVDFNLGSESSTLVIEELKERGVPFVLATGYAELGAKIDELGAMSVVRKPYGRAEIEQVLEAYASQAKVKPAKSKSSEAKSSEAKSA